MPKKKQKSNLPNKYLMLALVLCLFALGLVAFKSFKTQNSVPSSPTKQRSIPPIDDPVPTSNDEVFCTMEAKICADGSSVGRIGPNCEFAECPGESSQENWESLNKPEWGMSLQYPSNYQVLKNTAELAEIGYNDIPKLTILKTPEVYDEGNICDESPKNRYPCIHPAGNWGQSESIAKVTVGNHSAKSFYTTFGGPDNDYHVVSMTEGSSLQFKMYVAGGGLDQTFQQILETVEFK